MRYRRLLLHALLAPAALLCGCRSSTCKFDLWEGVWDGMIDSAFDAIDFGETSEEKIDRHRREVRQPQ
jgi:hypothetical protein